MQQIYLKKYKSIVLNFLVDVIQFHDVLNLLRFTEVEKKVGRAWPSG